MRAEESGKNRKPPEPFVIVSVNEICSTTRTLDRLPPPGSRTRPSRMNEPAGATVIDIVAGAVANRPVMVMTPNERAVTRPLDTVATVGALVVHVASDVTSLVEPSL